MIRGKSVAYVSVKDRTNFVGKGHNDSEQQKKKIWKTDRWSLEAVVSLIFLLTETSGQTQPEKLAVKKKKKKLNINLN